MKPFLRAATRVARSKWLLIGLGALSLAIGAVLAYDLVVELITGADPIGPFGAHHDFLAFYTAAHLVLLGKAGALYGTTLYQQTQYGIFPHHVGAAGYMPFLNPPFAAALLFPIALIPEPVARIIWFGLNLVLGVGICGYLVKSLNIKQRWLAALLLLGTFPVYENLIEGQLSLLMLGGCCLALMLANRQKLFVSGLFLSVLWLKPQFAILAIAALALFRGWRVIGGMLAALGVLVVIALPLTGIHPYLSYLAYLGGVVNSHLNGAGMVSAAVWKGQLRLTAGINGFFTGVLGQRAALLIDALTFLFDAILLGCYLLAVRRIPRGNYKDMKPTILALTVTSILLLDPHLFQQDVVLLFILLPILAKKLSRPWLGIIALTFTNLLILDFISPLHPFTVVLFCGTVGVCLAIITRRGPYRQLASSR